MSHQVSSTDLAGEKVQANLTDAPGNVAPSGGLKVVADKGWFANCAAFPGSGHSSRGYPHTMAALAAQTRLGQVADKPPSIVPFNVRCDSGELRSHRRDIEKAYMQAIEQSKSEIILAHAYFLSLRQTIETDGRRIMRDNWNQQPLYCRFMSWLSYGLLRSMMGISGYESENSQASIERITAPEG